MIHPNLHNMHNELERLERAEIWLHPAGGTVEEAAEKAQSAGEI